MWTPVDVLWALHRDRPREGVGSDRTTRELLDLRRAHPRGYLAVALRRR